MPQNNCRKGFRFLLHGPGDSLVASNEVAAGRIENWKPPAVKLFDILAILITFSAVFSYLNHRFLRFPRSIGLMLIAIVLSLLVTMLGWLGLGIDDTTRSLVASIDFNRALMGGMLSFLLFAGALHVNLGELAANKWTPHALWWPASTLIAL